MADAEEKARQDKIAAARLRVEQMKKRRAVNSGSGSSQKTESRKESINEPPATPTAAAVEEDEATATDNRTEGPDVVIHSSTASSLAQQSKIRSTSFRAGSGSGGAAPISPGLFSPDGDTAPEIYRKNVARIEKLEKENKWLEREATEAEMRWRKAEEALTDLREADGDDETQSKIAKDGQREKLENEVASLQRQNAQLQQQISHGTGHGPSHRLSVSTAGPSAELQAQVESKTATIECMEIEISKLQARVEHQATGASSEREQLTAPEEKVARAKATASKAQRELQDVKRNLERATEQAVREDSERSNAETKVKTLEKALEELKGAKEYAEKKAEALDKKVATLMTLHKEQNSQLQTLRKDKDQADKRVSDVTVRLEKLESENIKLRSRKSAEGDGGLDDEGEDELENEEKLRLYKTIHSLEHELHELRSGAWIEKRRKMEAMEPSFQVVDLTSADAAGHVATHKKGSAGGGLSDLLSSGLHALAGGGGDEGFLEDDGMDFDEDAFRRTQEDEALERLERIKEVKRSLKHWEGWRLDLVDLRRGGGEGIGDIFDV